MTAATNLLELTPARAADWEAEADGRVVVKVPKLTGRLGRWLLPRLRRPYVHVHLDREGSFVWRQCDGATPVAAIAERMQSELGAGGADVYDRIARFLRQLERGGLVRTTSGAPATITET